MYFYSMVVFCNGVHTSLIVKTSITELNLITITNRDNFALELIEAIEALAGVNLFKVEGDFVTFEEVEEFEGADFKALEPLPRQL